MTIETIDIAARRIDRATARLGSSAVAASWLATLGLDHASARRLGIVLEREDERGLAIAHPYYDRPGACRTLRHVVGEDDVMRASIAGAPTGVWSAPPAHGGHVLVLPSLGAMWRMQAAVGVDLGPYVAVAPSHGSGLPIEWREASYWRGFAAVTMLLDDVFTDGAVLAMVGAAAGALADVSSPPGLDEWSVVVRRPVGFTLADLVDAVGNALPVGLYLGAATDAERHQDESVDLHAVDGEGRVMRVVRVEERVASPGGQRLRTRDLVVRSDGMLLEVEVAPAPPGTQAGDRVVMLRDGTRLTRAPASSCGWSLGSVRRFLSGGRLDVSIEGDDLMRSVADEIRAWTGLDGSVVDIAAAFVMLSHVHLLFDELRVPLFHGGSAGARARLIGVLARLCHGGSVHSRARADVLATTARDAGGAILLDEPGALSGPGGATETGRFVLASSFAQAVWDRTSGSGRRDVNVFGPRAVFSHRPPAVGLQGVEFPVRIETDDRGNPARTSRDASVCRTLLDRLHVWSMELFRARAEGVGWSAGSAWKAVGALVRNGIDPHETGPAPSGCAPSMPDGELIMTDALDACAASGWPTLAMTQLLMEAALRGGTGPEFSPERVGRWLAASGRLSPDAPVTRRRLHGHISRLYELLPTEKGSGESSDPFAFCKSTRCADCRYLGVCGTIAPGMRDRKRAASK